jgi:hypothetical protein
MFSRFCAGVRISLEPDFGEEVEALSQRSTLSDIFQCAIAAKICLKGAAHLRFFG